MDRRSNEPFLWLLFSAGGMVAALFVPALLFLFGVAFPLGWISAPSHHDLLALARNPLTLLVLFGFCMLALFHWAHRFRYTLRDGLQLKRSDGLINLCCYGGATVGTVVAAIVLVQLR
jgi:fumarate reductase subunit D